MHHAATAAIAAADDLVVSEGTFTINPSDVYENVTILDPAEVIMNGGEINGEVVLTGTLTVNEGRIAGRIHDGGCDPIVWCGKLNIHGGVIENTVSLNSITMTGGEANASLAATGSVNFSGGTAASLHGRRWGDSSGGFVSVTGGVVTGGVSPGIFDSQFGIWGGGVSIENATVGNATAATLGPGAVVGSASLSSINEGAVVDQAYNSFIYGGVVKFLASDCAVVGGRILGDVSISPDILPYISSAQIVNTEILGDVFVEEWPANIHSIQNSVIRGRVNIPGPDRGTTIPVHAAWIDGEPVDLSSPHVIFGPLDPFTIEMILPDGRRSVTDFSIGEMYGAPSSLRLTQAPLLLEGCTAADIAVPHGVLDLVDLTAFVALFGVADPAVDFAEPFGVVDLADITAMIESFTTGCP